MTRRVRVVLSPAPSPARGEHRAVVRACGVSLSSLGKSGSTATHGEEKPAELTFDLKRLKDAADTAGSLLVAVGTFSGKISLSGGKPFFFLEKVHDEKKFENSPEDSVVRFPRFIQLDCDAAVFDGEPVFGEKRPRIFIDDADLEGFRHLELTAKLAIAGSDESAVEVNDRLDVPLTTEFLALSLVDEAGEPLKNVPIVLDFPFDEVKATTDGEGKVRVTNPPGGASAVLSFVDEAAIKKELESRWRKVRKKPRVQPGRAVSVLSVSATFDEISLAPGVRTVSIQPRVVLARIVGAMFETSKVFLLPSAKPSLESMGALYQEHAEGKVLIVGHADRAGSASYNAQLSLERADALLAYLRGDVDAWLAWYGQGKPDEKRWGAREDRTMLRSFPDGADLFATPDPIARYREARGISETGATGPATRKALVKEYMAAGSEPLPADIDATSHGCGEHFPAVETPDGVTEEENRRVELFFFGGEFGILPAPKGKNSNAGSEEYPEWRRRAQQTHDFDVRLGFSRLLRLTLLDGEHEPLANMKWSILHDFGQEEGVTDGDGNLVARLPHRLENAVLVHEFGSVQLSLAQLDPVEQVSGLQKRLRNLGYDCTTSGEIDDATRQAVTEFQIDEELEETGEPNAQTRERLRALYGH